MKAMILAAGVGERMRPLTDHTPKPLLRVAGTPLIEHHIRRLASAGFRQLVINVSHLGQQIIDYCGTGENWGVSIEYSREQQPLETAGGILEALPLLGDAPFLVINGDVWIDYPLARILDVGVPAFDRAHLVLVENPPQHPLGDFKLRDNGRIVERTGSDKGYTYAGLGVYSAAFFAGLAPGKLPLRPLLDSEIAAGRLSGEFFPGAWVDVGTPERLRALDKVVSRN